jgi:vacuolar-type H+-ATPase subunit H
MGFTVLFLLLLVTAGWWLHSRWSALREAQEARREAELMMVFEARSRAKEKPAATTASASDFYPTLPEQAQQQAQTSKRSASSQAQRPRGAE